MNENLELKLQAWLDGELSAADAQQLDREMTGNTAANGLVAELRAVKAAMAGAETALTLPESREFFWSKIQRQIEREAVAAAPAPKRPLALLQHWLSPMVGLAGLACMLVLALAPVAPPTFDEISATGEGMEAVTFHDQSAGMTVVWLADSNADQQDQTTAPETPSTPKAEKGDSEVEME